MQWNDVSEDGIRPINIINLSAALSPHPQQSQDDASHIQFPDLIEGETAFDGFPILFLEWTAE
jgi:hypothetical protein